MTSRAADYRSAEISECGRYRYSLIRRWGEADGPHALFIMLNPSTADAEQDDPTIRRCIGFAKAWGMHGLCVVNLFAHRATNPKDLEASTGDVVGPGNDRWIVASAQAATFSGGPVVVAWGASLPGDLGRPVAFGVVRMLRHHGIEMQCLGRTKLGYPRHPLYVKGDTELEPFAQHEATVSNNSEQSGE